MIVEGVEKFDEVFTLFVTSFTTGEFDFYFLVVIKLKSRVLGY